MLAQRLVWLRLWKRCQAAGTFAKNYNEPAFATTIGNISFKVPYGHTGLNPIWQATIATIYSPAVPGSGNAMVFALKQELAAYIKAGVATHTFAFKKT